MVKLLQLLNIIIRIAVELSEVIQCNRNKMLKPHNLIVEVVRKKLLQLNHKIQRLDCSLIFDGEMLNLNPTGEVEAALRTIINLRIHLLFQNGMFFISQNYKLYKNNILQV